MRKKFSKYGLDLPILPTTTVGSLPKPPKLKKLRKEHLKGELNKQDLRAIEDEATEKWVEIQEDIDLDILVDGEMYRGDMVSFFARNLNGLEIGGLVRSYGNRYYRKPKIIEEIIWDQPVTLDYWKFADSLTDKPVKAIITGPYTMMDWSFDEYYHSRKEACLSFAKVLRNEVESLVDSGAKIIQIDEPAIAVRPGELMDFVDDAINILTRDLDAYFIIHACYGTFNEIYPGILDLDCDNLDLELSNDDFRLADEFDERVHTKDISAGVIDVHTREIEDIKVVKSRIENLLEILDSKKVWIDPDCGLKTRKENEAREKLANMVEATKIIRKELLKS